MYRTLSFSLRIGLVGDGTSCFITQIRMNVENVKKTNMKAYFMHVQRIVSLLRKNNNNKS